MFACQIKGVRLASLCILTLFVAACDPQELADKAGRRAAESVVLPVVAKYLPGPQADQATRCIIETAPAADIKALVRDIGVEAGPSTIETVLRMASTPEAAACMLNAGILPLGVPR